MTAADRPGGAAPRRPRRPGLRDQTKRTFEAGRGLLDAHVELARTEFRPILDNVKIAAAEFGIAIAMVLFIAILVPVGSTLFLGEWLFGSMGWGVLHGAIFSAAIAVTAIVLFLDPNPRPVELAVVLGVLVGFVAAVIFALNVTNIFWEAVADAMNLDLAEEWRLLVTAAMLSAIAGAVVGAIIGAWQGGPSSIVNGLVTGTLVGVLVGAFTAIAFGLQVGIALGVLVGLLGWIGFMLYDLSRRGVDEDSFRARFYPEQTVETARETLVFLGVRPDETAPAAQQAADAAQEAVETADAAAADATTAATDAVRGAEDTAQRAADGPEPRDEEPS